MSDDYELRERVRQALQAGTLPDAPPERTWGGRGTGVSCTICAEPIRANEVEFELEFSHRNGELRRDNYHVHLRCFAAWDLERHDFALSQTGVLPTLSDVPDHGTMNGRERQPAYKRGSA